jgi:transglutaminase-like putative cysteine protease
LLLGLLGAALGQAAVAAEARPRARTFDFTYAATLTGLEPGAKVRLWAPVASASDDQDVEVVSREVRGEKGVPTKVAAEPHYGNRVLYAEPRADAAGRVALKVVYQVTRREVKGQTGPKEDPRLARFLQADALVPIGGKPLELLRGKELPDDPMKKARALYDLVNAHLRYAKDGEGWGRGDSAWACDSRFGNCSDFHSLFISLARSQKIPARFEIGFPLPQKRGSGQVPGYHCWAFFRPEGKRWVPVDISEANKDPRKRDYYFGNLSEDRVAFSVGRDLDLVPRQAGKALNFFIYPYAEVDGKEWPQAKVLKKFTFKDQE